VTRKTLWHHLREWLLALPFALPLVAAWIIADRAIGWGFWIAVVFLFVYAAGLVALTLAYEYWAWGQLWRQLLDDDEPSAQHTYDLRKKGSGKTFFPVALPLVHPCLRKS
jgi:hypothetical protein